jgi:hypothetical protein
MHLVTPFQNVSNVKNSIICTSLQGDQMFLLENRQKVAYKIAYFL